jgi:hypothetical protein
MATQLIAPNGKKKMGRPPAREPRGKFLYSTAQTRLDWIETQAQATGTSKASILDWAIDELRDRLGQNDES